jgi:aspartate racemase
MTSPLPTPAPSDAAKTCIGLIGGLGTMAGADVHGKLLRTIAAGRHPDHYRILYEQHPFAGQDSLDSDAPALDGRKLYIYDMLSRYELAGADVAMLPCFVSHTFLHQLRNELRLPIVSLMDALSAGLRKRAPEARTIGVLTSDYVRKQGLFERQLGAGGYRLVYPPTAIQRRCVMDAVYGQNGLKADPSSARAVALLWEACHSLVAQGADLIVPGTTEIAMIASLLGATGVPVMDSNQAYVDYALAIRQPVAPQGFKIGIIGGVGPAATVDFMDKIISNTTAGRDQEHIKLIVDHNPQIPDRTANLIGDGEDPTLAIYAACKRLEANHADLIAIPCNTAHAYVQRIAGQVAVPIINMLHETVNHINRQHGGHRKVGLLATTGTVRSGVYHEAAAGAPFELLVPDQPHQELLMRAIYGERGIKAGHLDGQCRTDLMQALAHLVHAGASVVILGCTELPLLLRENPAFPFGEDSIVLLDPTAILARRCVEAAQAGAARRQDTA